VPTTTGQHSLAASNRTRHLTLSPKKPRSQNNQPCLHRSQHSRLRFKPPLTPPHQRFLFRIFRVFRGEPWFPVQNTVIEQVHTRLARAKAQATVVGPRCHECPRNPSSRHSAFFRVLPRPKKRHTRSQNNLFCPPPFTTFPPPLQASPDTATPTIPVPCVPCLPW